MLILSSALEYALLPLIFFFMSAFSFSLSGCAMIPMLLLFLLSSCVMVSHVINYLLIHRCPCLFPALFFVDHMIPLALFHTLTLSYVV